MRRVQLVALALAVGLATAVAPFAASSPDGLSRVAADQAFAQRGATRDGPIAGYAFPGVHDERLAKGLAGFTGTLLVFGLGRLIVVTARRRTAAA